MESLLFPVVIICVLFDWSVSLSKRKVGTVGCTLWLALSKQIKLLFFFVTTTLFSPHPTPLPPFHTEIVAQFYPWSKFYIRLFQTHYHTLPYLKTYLPRQQPTLVVDSGDSLFLTSLLSPTVNSLNNPTTGRRNKSSKQDPRVALCCSLVFIYQKNSDKKWKKSKNFEEEAKLTRQYIVTAHQFHNKICFVLRSWTKLQKLISDKLCSISTLQMYHSN